MIKLLINDPNEIQQLLEINDSGSYFDLSCVLWDERFDGEFTFDKSKVGGFIRVENSLVFNQDRFNSQVLKLTPPYEVLRKREYQKRIDPFLAEAITDKEMGDSTKMTSLIAEKELIKLEIPKPE